MDQRLRELERTKSLDPSKAKEEFAIRKRYGLLTSEEQQDERILKFYFLCENIFDKIKTLYIPAIDLSLVWEPPVRKTITLRGERVAHYSYTCGGINSEALEKILTDNDLEVLEKEYLRIKG